MASRDQKRIAFLSFDWDYEIIGEYYKGIEAGLEQLTDLQVVIFSAFGHYHVHYEAVSSTFGVFSLCDLEQYDGLIVQGNRAWPPAEKDPRS